MLRMVICLTIGQTGKKRVLFDAEKDGQNISPKWVPAIENQEPNESRRSVGLIHALMYQSHYRSITGYGTISPRRLH